MLTESEELQLKEIISKLEYLEKRGSNDEQLVTEYKLLINKKYEKQISEDI